MWNLYFCKRRFYDFYDKIKLYPEKYSRLVEAFDACRFADRAFDLDTVKMRESVKSSICVQGCSRCRYEDECFYRRMTERNRFGQFDFQVTNHQLFLTSARMRYEEQHPLLIDSDLVIIDEAHKLHDAALDATGDQLAENEIKRYVSAVGHLNSKKEECNGLGEFVNTICVPEMLIKLRQGLGRLIRCETDTGLISVLDTRATTGKYADKVGNVLAKYTKAETLDEVEAFFREVKSPAYFEV